MPIKFLQNKTNTAKQIINKRKIFGAGLFLTLLFGLSIISLGAVKKTAEKFSITPAPLNTLAPDPVYDLASIHDLPGATNLPIADIEEYEVENPRGTAIFIPQIHKNPGSESKDAANDTAEIAQEQIYDIINHLNKFYGLDLVVVEGELNGFVPENASDRVAAKIKERNMLALHLEEFKKILSRKSYDAKLESKITKNLEKAIADLDRDIILSGAPYKLKAEGKDLTLYGTEIKSTQDEGKVIVRDYIYLNDRISSLNNKQSNQFAGLNYKNMLSMFKKISPASSIFRDLGSLKSLAENNDNGELTSVLENLNSDLSRLDVKEEAINSSAPSREDNPYKSETNINKLKGLLQGVEQKIQDVVINKRNKETAQSFSDSLFVTKEKAGILQFGAGHKDGLIKELNNEGTSVIVITPEKVAKRQPST